MVRAGPARRAAARLGNAAVRPVLAAPGPRVRAARHALPGGAPRVRRAHRRRDQRAVPARTALVPRRVHVLPDAGRDARRGGAALADRAGRLLARHAGRVAGRVQRARRPDRPLPDGFGAALPDRPPRQRHRERSRRSTSTRSARSTPFRTSACCPRASSRSTRAAARASAAGSARCSRATRRSRRSTRTSRTASCPGGIEYYLPLFFEATATLADYLPATAIVALHGDVRNAIDHFWQDTESRYRLLRGDKARPLLPPTELFLPGDAFNGAIKGLARIELRTEGAGPTQPVPSVQVDRRAEDPLAALKRFLATTDLKVALVAESAGRRETMQHFFAEFGVEPAQGEHFAGLLASTRARDPAAVAGRGRLRLAGGRPRVRHRGGALRGRRAPDRARGGQAVQRRRDGARPLRGAHRRSGRARGARHRPVPGPPHARPGRRAQRVPAARVRERREAVRAGVEPAPHQPLQRRVAGGGAAARARQRPVGKGEEEGGAAGARHGGGTAQPLCAARGAQGLRVRLQGARLRALRRGLRLRRDWPTRRRRSRPSSRT